MLNTVSKVFPPSWPILVVSVPSLGVAFLRGVNVFLAMLRVLALMAMVITDVIVVLRKQLSDRYSNAWEEARVATVHNRWLLLLPPAAPQDDRELGDSEDRRPAFSSASDVFSSSSASTHGCGGCRGDDACGGCCAGPSCARTTWESLHVLPLRLLTGQAAALCCLVVTALWVLYVFVHAPAAAQIAPPPPPLPLPPRAQKNHFLTPTRALGPAPNRSLTESIKRGAVRFSATRAALATLCATGPLPSACTDGGLSEWIVVSLAGLDDLLRVLPTAVYVGVAVGSAVAAINVVLAAAHFIADHRLAATIRLRGFSTLEVASSASLSGTAAGWERRIGGGGSGRWKRAQPERESSYRGSTPGGGGGDRADLRADSAEFEEEALRLAAWRWALDLLPRRHGLTSLHGVPALAAHSQAFAFDYIPTLCASAVLSAVLVGVLATAAVLLMAVSDRVTPVSLGLVATVGGLLLLRAAGYTALQLLLVSFNGRVLRLP